MIPQTLSFLKKHKIRDYSTQIKNLPLIDTHLFSLKCRFLNYEILIELSVRVKMRKIFILFSKEQHQKLQIRKICHTKYYNNYLFQDKMALKIIKNPMA